MGEEINYTAIWAAAATGLTAAIVGLIGFFTSRLTARVAARQIEAETERLEAGHAETHLQHRQGIYHDVLNRERRLLDVINSEGDRTAAFNAYRELTEAINGASLFGTAEVGRRAMVFQDVVGGVIGAADDRTQQGEPWTDAAIDEMLRLGQQWIKTRVELRDAMRVDVSVDLAPLGEPEVPDEQPALPQQALAVGEDAPEADEPQD